MTRFALMGAVALVLLFSANPADAGWLKDKLKEAGEKIAGKAVDDAADEAYEEGKEAMSKDGQEQSSDETAGSDGQESPDEQVDEEDQYADEEYDEEEFASEAAFSDGAGQRERPQRKQEPFKPRSTDHHFVADMVMTGPDTPEEMPDGMTSRLVVDGERLRFDLNTPGGGSSIIQLGVNIGDKAYMVYHGMKQYMESKIDPDNAMGMMDESNNPCEEDPNARKLGSDEVAGRAAVKWSCAWEDDDGESGSGIVWIDKEYGFPLGWDDAQSGNKWMVTSFRETRSDDSLFRPPADYKVMQVQFTMPSR